MLERARELLEGSGASRALAATLAEAGRIAVFDNREDEAVEFCAAALRLTDELGLDDLGVTVTNTLGVVRIVQGRLRDAEALYRSVVEGGVRSSELTRAQLLVRGKPGGCGRHIWSTPAEPWTPPTSTSRSAGRRRRR
jgi:Flp pilus assembly protein TadD